MPSVSAGSPARGAAGAGCQLGVERINGADIWNVSIALRFFCLPAERVSIAHAIPLDETTAGPLDLYANGRAVTAIDMPAQFIVATRRAIIATKEFRLTVRV